MNSIQVCPDSTLFFERSHHTARTLSCSPYAQNAIHGIRLEMRRDFHGRGEPEVDGHPGEGDTVFNHHALDFPGAVSHIEASVGEGERGRIGGTKRRMYFARL